MNGEDIIDVLKYVKQFFNEIAQLISKIDDSMIREKWIPIQGSTITTGLSKSLDNPNEWLPFMNFRVYSQKNFPNTIISINICYDTDILKQPIIICGMVEFKDKKSINYWKDYWILYNLWIEDKNGNKKTDGTIYSDFNNEDMNLVKKAKLFSYNLVEIKNEMEINNKILKQLKNKILKQLKNNKNI